MEELDYNYTKQKFLDLYKEMYDTNKLIYKMSNNDYVFNILTHILYDINENWKNIKYGELYNEVMKIAKENNFNENLLGHLKEYFPKGIEDIKKETQNIKNTSTHLPAKPLKLKEDEEKKCF